MNAIPSRPLVALATFVLFACDRRAHEPLQVPPSGWQSAHWTVVRRVQGGSVGNKPPAKFEVWMKGSNALIGATAGGGDQVRVLLLDTVAYGWRVGQPTGLRYDAPSTDERQMLVPSVDWVRRAAACSFGGKRGTTGTFDGHPFVRYDCDEKSDSTQRTYYYATDLQGFPVHATITYPDRTIVIYDAKSVEVPASFPDSLLQVPAGIQWDEGPA